MKFKKLYLIIVFFKFCLLSFSQDVSICEGDTLRFNSTASDLSNYLEWEFILDNGSQIISGQNTQSLLVRFNNPGDYILQFRESALSDCYAIVEQTIEVLPNPLADFTNGNICIYDSVKFINNSTTLDGIQSSEWRLNDYTYNDLNFTYKFDNSGDYIIELTVVDNNGCSDKEALTFRVYDKPKSNFYHLPENISTLKPEVQFYNTSLNAAAAWWSFGDYSNSDEWEPAYSFDSIGWFDIELLIEDDNGCKDSITKRLLVENDLIYFFPNSFTPDGDGLNDTFGIQGFSIETYQEFYFEITNRWGLVIFNSNDFNEFWNGKTHKGNDAPTGNYIWSISLKDKLGKVTKDMGEFKLIR